MPLRRKVELFQNQLRPTQKDSASLWSRIGLAKTCELGQCVLVDHGVLKKNGPRKVFQKSEPWKKTESEITNRKTVFSDTLKGFEPAQQLPVTLHWRMLFYPRNESRCTVKRNNETRTGITHVMCKSLHGGQKHVVEIKFLLMPPTRCRPLLHCFDIQMWNKDGIHGTNSFQTLLLGKTLVNLKVLFPCSP